LVIPSHARPDRVLDVDRLGHPSRSSDVNWFTRIWNSSIGKKVLVAITGLALLGFLFGHIFGNLHIYWGAEYFNAYADGLHQMKVLLPVAEIGILLAFIAHIVLVVRLTLENN